MGSNIFYIAALKGFRAVEIYSKGERDAQKIALAGGVVVNEQFDTARERDAFEAGMRRFSEPGQSIIIEKGEQ